MDIRTALSSDTNKIKALWDYSFGFSEPFINWSLQKNIANALIAADGDMIYSVLCSMPYTLNIGGTNVNAVYITGGATAPEKRRLGIQKELLSQTLYDARSKSCPIAITVPFNYKTAEKYGFRTAYTYKQYDIGIADIPSYSLRGSISYHHLGTPTSQLDNVYNKFMQSKSGYVVRTELNWQMILEDLISNFGGRCAVLTNDDGICTGYVMYLVHENSIRIYELAYSDRRAYESLMAFVKNHGVQTEKASLKVSSDDLSYLDFCDCRNACTVMPFAMARITDASAVLSMLAGMVSVPFNIEIIDRFIPENSGTYSVSHGCVTASDQSADVITDIGTLTHLFMGSLSVDEAKALNLIEKNADVLEQIFKKKTNYINMLCM